MNVVSYPKSSSNHNQRTDSNPGVVVVSYPKSSSNHNKLRSLPPCSELYLILNHHQTTTLEVCKLI